MLPPSNDMCRHTPEGYLDVIWNYKGRWTALVYGRFIGHWPTKRRAKKAIRRTVSHK